MSTTATSIEWTDRTWNPVRGCSRVSEGCRNCYAERTAARFSGPGQPFEGFVHMRPINEFSAPMERNPAYLHDLSLAGKWTGKVELLEDKLLEPLSWRKPARIFVNSMSDLLHENLPDEAIDRVFAVMALCQQHTFQVLTKRPQRMARYFETHHAHGLRKFDDVRKWMHLQSRGGMLPEIDWPLGNVWLGTSVEDQQTADDRIPWLLKTPAALRFVSYEPALGPVDLRHLQPEKMVEIDALRGTHGVIRPHRATNEKLDWVIVGGESGPGARAFNIKWAGDVVTDCRDTAVPCFVKQLGKNPEETVIVPRDGYQWQRAIVLRDRKGGDINEWPSHLRVREFPMAGVVSPVGTLRKQEEAQ